MTEDFSSSRRLENSDCSFRTKLTRNIDGLVRVIQETKFPGKKKVPFDK